MHIEKPIRLIAPSKVSSELHDFRCSIRTADAHTRPTPHTELTRGAVAPCVRFDRRGGSLVGYRWRSGARGQGVSNVDLQHGQGHQNKLQKQLTNTKEAEDRGTDTKPAGRVNSLFVLKARRPKKQKNKKTRQEAGCE